MSGLSACIIARDEEAMLPDCLASLVGWVDEIRLLDTGSRDRTREIALEHGAKVETMEWISDFSAARNRSLEMASQPWVLVIDADERLEATSGQMLRAAIESRDALAFLVTLDDLRPGGRGERVALPRLFRRRPEIRFSRPVHENVLESLFALGRVALADSGVRLMHLGYLPEVLARRDKHGRNLSILQRHFKEAPRDLYTAYKLALTLPVHAQPEKLRVFAHAQALTDALSDEERDEHPFLSRLFDAHAASLAASGQMSAAIALADRGMSLFPRAADVTSRRGDLAWRVGDLGRASELLMEGYRLTAHTSILRAESPHELRMRCWIALFGIAEFGGEPRYPPRDVATSEPIVRCAELMVLLRRGQVEPASAALAPLLESDFERDEVKLCAGRLAFEVRDFDTAEAMWALTRDVSDAGRKSRAWLALLSVIRAKPPALVAPPADLASAALAQMLAEINGQPLMLDAAFRPQSLRAERARWCRELRHANRADVAERLEPLGRQFCRK